MQVVPGPALALRIRGAARASKTGFGKYTSLPTTLSGSYTLQLSDDTYLFTGVIVLSQHQYTIIIGKKRSARL